MKEASSSIKIILVNSLLLWIGSRISIVYLISAKGVTSLEKMGRTKQRDCIVDCDVRANRR